MGRGAFMLNSALFFGLAPITVYYTPCRESRMSSKPSLQRADIEKIAHLARLGIAEADVPEYARELSNILGLVEQMSAVDTAGVSPMAHPLDAQQRLREDVVTEQNQRELLQANAPQVEAGLFLVPQVIE